VTVAADAVSVAGKADMPIIASERKALSIFRIFYPPLK
jgi:hypothetical protein